MNSYVPREIGIRSSKEQQYLDRRHTFHFLELGKVPIVKQIFKNMKIFEYSDYAELTIECLTIIVQAIKNLRRVRMHLYNQLDMLSKFLSFLLN